MSAKCLDQQGRWRNKVVAFRMSPEEDELLETTVRLSGLTKQEYIIRRLQEKEVVVTGNPKVYKALKKELEKVLSVFFFGCDMSLFRLPCSKFPLTFLAVPAGKDRRIECPCQSFDGFIGVRGNICGLFLFVQTHTPLDFC